MSPAIALPRPSQRPVINATRRVTSCVSCHLKMMSMYLLTSPNFSSPATALRRLHKAAVATTVAAEASLLARNVTVAARLVTLPVNAPKALKSEEEVGTTLALTITLSEETVEEARRPGMVLIIYFMGERD